MKRFKLWHVTTLLAIALILSAAAFARTTKEDWSSPKMVKDLKPRSVIVRTSKVFGGPSSPDLVTETRRYRLKLTEDEAATALKNDLLARAFVPLRSHPQTAYTFVSTGRHDWRNTRGEYAMIHLTPAFDPISGFLDPNLMEITVFVQRHRTIPEKVTSFFRNILP